MNYFEMLTSQPFVAHYILVGFSFESSFGLFFSFVQDFLEAWTSINIFWSWFYSCFILYTRFWPNVSNLNHTRLCHFKDLDDIVFRALLLFHKLFIFPFFSLFFQTITNVNIARLFDIGYPKNLYESFFDKYPPQKGKAKFMYFEQDSLNCFVAFAWKWRVNSRSLSISI